MLSDHRLHFHLKTNITLVPYCSCGISYGNFKRTPLPPPKIISLVKNNNMYIILSMDPIFRTVLIVLSCEKSQQYILKIYPLIPFIFQITKNNTNIYISQKTIEIEGNRQICYYNIVNLLFISLT